MRIHAGVGRLGQTDWGGYLTKAVDTATNILTERYAQPPAGTYIQTNPDGSQTLIRATEGGSLPVIAGQATVKADLFPPTLLPLLVGGVMFIGLMVMMSGGRSKKGPWG